MTAMTDRFQRQRWGETRIAIDEMRAGQVKPFGQAEFSNVRSSVARLNDAYEGERLYEYKCDRYTPIVTRVR